MLILIPVKYFCFVFRYQLLRLEGEQYLARLRLKVPKTDLITLAIFSRNYSKDIIQNKSESK